MPANKPQTLGELAASCNASFGTSGVRGRVEDLSPQLCHAYTHAFLGIVAQNDKRLLIGHDLRPSSPAIATMCHAAARQVGWETIHAGVLPTPALAFAAQEAGCPAIMVTGSHIPFDRNGIKFYHARGEITKADEASILSTLLPSVPVPAGSPLPTASPHPLELYIDRYLKAFPKGALTGLTIGVYEHSSVARDALHRILGALGAKTVSLGRSDGFVAIDTEAVRREDIEIAPVWVNAHGLDTIVTTDGDADRPLIADERGRWLRGDVLGLLCAREVGAGTVVTPVSSNTALEESGFFNTVIRTRIGSPHVIAGMEGSSAEPVVGFEANGGFLLGSRVSLPDGELLPLRTRDAVLPILAVLAAARRRNCRLSDLLTDLPSRHTASGRLQNIDTAVSRGMLAELMEDKAALASLLAPCSGAVTAIDLTDGLRATFGNGDIVHLRPSGNAPELRCYAEAAEARDAEQLCDACLARISRQLGD